MKKFIFFLYAIILTAFTFFSYLFLDQNLSYLKQVYSGFAFEQREITTIIYTVFIVLLFIFYFIFLYLIKKEKLKNKDVKILIFITIGILFLSYPAMLSYDIFNYLTTAKVLFFYHENPYIVMPIEFIGEPFLSFTRAANKLALYGPAWELFSGVPYMLGSGNFIMTLLSFKLFMVLFYIGTISLIFKISKSIFSVLFFALNPLIVIETLISSHNDIVMMFFALLSFFLLMRKKILLAIVMLALSISIKYATVFLLPIFIFTLLKTLRDRKIDWNRVFSFSAVFMFIIFLLSPIREEMYPWYGIWFILFLCLLQRKKIIVYLVAVISFALLLRYIGFMFLGTYFGVTPVLKLLVTWIPPFLILGYYGVHRVLGKHRA